MPRQASRVPFTLATAKSRVTATSTAKREVGKPAVIADTFMPPGPAPTRYASAKASSPTFSRQTVPMTIAAARAASETQAGFTPERGGQPPAPRRGG